jgi:hypothetical protein
MPIDPMGHGPTEATTPPDPADEPCTCLIVATVTGRSGDTGPVRARTTFATATTPSVQACHDYVSGTAIRAFLAIDPDYQVLRVETVEVADEAVLAVAAARGWTPPAAG